MDLDYSSTACLDWAIWRIVRILAQSPSSTVRLTIIRHGLDAVPPEMSCNAETVLEDFGKDLGKNRHDMRSRIVQAKTFASRTKEIFYLGRIFPANIETDLEFTSKVGSLYSGW